MSDRDTKGLEPILIDGVVALQCGDLKTYVMRDRDKNIAEQSGNAALIEALAWVELQIQHRGPIRKLKPGVRRTRCTDATISCRH
jgi:hypothetical protein